MSKTTIDRSDSEFQARVKTAFADIHAKCGMSGGDTTPMWAVIIGAYIGYALRIDDELAGIRARNADKKKD